MDINYHNPVMKQEVIEGLGISPNGIYVDVTFGGGGHSAAILERLGEGGRLMSFDQDEDALLNTENNEFFKLDKRFTLVDQNFIYLKNYLRVYSATPVDGILADLGVSSHQFDVAERGFSIRSKGKLDMRMDKRQELTAAQIVNAYEEEELSNVLYNYGEVFNARKLARAMVERREEKRFVYTDELVEFATKFAPRGKMNKYLAMVFQALRIEVNGELKALENFLTQSLEVLKPGGRLVVMSYHSLEDRMVKNFMKSGNFKGEIEKDFYGNNLSPFTLISRKAITPSKEELELNTRSRSAKLRIAEKK